jgi:hypothetical protein
MKLNTDRIVSLSAMVVGISSLFIIIYQTHLIRQAQNASVLPYLMIAIQSNNDGVFVVVSNTGIGPARIDDVRVRYQGREIEGDPYEFYTGLHPDAVTGGINVNKLVPGRLIPAGAWIQNLGISGSGERVQMFLADLLRLFEVAEVPQSWYVEAGASGTEKAVIEITYSSVYGDRWRLRSDRFVPERL